MDNRDDGNDGGPKDIAIQRQVNELISRLPRYAIRAVIDEIDGKAQGGERAKQLKGALVDHFNKLRPHKARRLFTGLFDPLLVDDTVLYRGREYVPGLLQRVDMGGVWYSLSNLAFPQLAAQVQQELDVLSKDNLLDKVLMSSAALAMREQMRVEAVRFLNTLPRNRKALEAFLQLVNEVALEDAKSRTPHLVFKAAVDTRMLAFVLDILNQNDKLLPSIERFKAKTGKPPQSDEDIVFQSEVIVITSRELRYVITDVSKDHLIFHLPPLILMNEKQRFDVVLRYLRDNVVETGPNELGFAVEAMVAHFAAASSTIGDMVKEVFDNQRSQDVSTVALSKPVRTTMNAALARFETTLKSMNAGGILGNRRAMIKIKDYWMEVARVLTTKVAPIAAERAGAAAMSRNSTVLDHEDVLWLLDYLWRWSSVMSDIGYSNAEILNLRSRVIDDVQFAFSKAMKFDERDKLDGRMAHFVRLNQILRCFETDLGSWITAVSHSLMKCVRWVLEQERKLSPDEVFIVDRYIETVREELTKSRAWQSPELVSLVKLYEARRAQA